MISQERSVRQLKRLIRVHSRSLSVRFQTESSEFKQDARADKSIFALISCLLRTIHLPISLSAY